MNLHLKLLDTKGGNTKIKKSAKNTTYRLASLSLMPDAKICPASKSAGCFDGCLKSSGRGRFDNVAKGRQWRSDLYHTDQDQFLERLIKELDNFSKLCEKQGVKPAVRLNVLSDIPFERFGIMDIFPEIYFWDYTKRAERITNPNKPKNYDLIFSYSGREQFAKQAEIGLNSDCPVAVVFKDKLPAYFMGRPVIDGDQSDLINAKSGRVIVGLRAKGSLAKNENNGFVVDPEIIPALAVA